MAAFSRIVRESFFFVLKNFVILILNDVMLFLYCIHLQLTCILNKSGQRLKNIQVKIRLYFVNGLNPGAVSVEGSSEKNCCWLLTFRQPEWKSPSESNE